MILRTALFSIVMLPVSVFTLGAVEPVHSIIEDDAELFSENKMIFPQYAVPAAGMEMLFGSEDSEMARDLIAFAKKYLGLRYRRGGKTPSGFDCSGFTGYVFGQFGYSLGASSRDQFRDGVEIENLDIKPGDLLFFNGRSVGKRVGHVGIAIANDAESGIVTFIHSSVTGGIRIDKTSDPYYSRRFLGARRVLTE